MNNMYVSLSSDDLVFKSSTDKLYQKHYIIKDNYFNLHRSDIATIAAPQDLLLII